MPQRRSLDADADGFVRLGRYAYRVFDTPARYATARAQCEALGATLLTLHDADTARVLHAFADKRTYWLGLRMDAGGVADGTGADGDDLAWPDGTLVDFAPWLPGEPNNHGGNEHCVAVNYRDPAKPTGGCAACWNDCPCGNGQRRPYICQRL